LNGIFFDTYLKEKIISKCSINPFSISKNQPYVSFFRKIFSPAPNTKPMNRKRISPIVSILIIFMVLSGCVEYRYVASDRFRINDFPTPPHNYKVELYFAGEKLPEQDYIRTHMFPVYSGGSAAEMVKGIHAAAENAHVDAVIILSPERYMDYELDAYRTSVTGIGIKFKENVDYLHNYRFVNKLYVFDLDSMDYRHIADLFPNFNNQIFHVNVIDSTPTTNFYYENYIKKYSLPFLLEDKGSEWRYKKDEKGRERERSYFKYNQKKFSLNIYYENNLPTFLRIKFITTGYLVEERSIRINYNQNDQITEKTIFDRKTPLLKEVFSYDEEGKLVESIYYRIEDTLEKPFLKTTYIYFENADVYQYF
jgi:hypothetical protein